MAAYAATVTPVQPTIVKLLNFFGLGIVYGKVTISNYNQTTVPELTALTGLFRATPCVVCSGVSNGAVKQLVRWSEADKGFRCYVPTTGAETATDVNVGDVNFIAIGRA